MIWTDQEEDMQDINIRRTLAAHGIPLKADIHKYDYTADQSHRNQWRVNWWHVLGFVAVPLFGLAVWTVVVWLIAEAVR